MLSIAKVSFKELENDTDFPALTIEYAHESAINGLPPPTAKLPTYRTLNENGLLTVFVARDEGRLAGFIMVLFHEIPHYSIRLAMTESYFVFGHMRSTGAGDRLREAAEQFSEEAGAPGYFISSPVDGPLVTILPRKGYVKTNEVFFKRFTRE